LLRPPANPVTVGTHDYTEQHVLAEVLRDRLAAAGFHVEQVKGMAQQVTLDSVCAGTVDVCVDYTGNVWTARMRKDEPADRATTLRAVADYLRTRHGVECLGALGFENAYALAMRRADAERLNIRTLDDLARHSRTMTIAGDLQFFRLPEWKRAQALYGLKFAGAPTPMDPTLMYGAIRNKEVDVISAYTSDGRIAAYDLVVLEERGAKQAFPPYDAILLVSHKADGKPGLREALTPLVGAIDLDRMRQANRRVDIERAWPRKAGRELLDVLRTRRAAGLVAPGGAS
jgi:osmoprotectant transport system permease protein